MTDTWGNLSDKDKQAIQSNARKLTETEINKRYAKKDGKNVFRIVRKTDRALTGVLDIDYTAHKKEIKRYEIAEIALIPPEDFDYEPDITSDDRKAAESIDKLMSNFEGYYAQDTDIIGETAIAAREAESFGLPPIVDHRASQSPVKDQRSRGTCVAHATMALLEAYGHIPDDLSEQYTHYKFNVFSQQQQNTNSGLKTTLAALFLSRSDGRTCLESDWPYIPDQDTINSMVAAGTYNPPLAALNNQTYGIGAYKIIIDQGLTGESIKNTRYLESLLYQGYNIVIGTWVSWDDEDNNGILDPVLDPNGNPIGIGGHAMLVVGYNRNEQYFIVKNSWNKTWGHDGYAYLHYDLIRSCFKYGFVIDRVIPNL